MAYILNNEIKFDGTRNPGIDAGGRLRTSVPETLGDYKQLGSPNALLINYTGSGANLYVTGSSKTVLSVTGSQFGIYQTKQWHPYQSGKSQFGEVTFTNFQLEPGITKRVGYYSDSTASVSSFSSSIDGLSLLNDGTDYYLEIHRSGTQTHRVARSNWDDPLDGTGPSGTTVNFENFTVIGFDFLWLGGTAVRWYAMVSGSFREFHKIEHAGYQKDVMMTSPSQPLRGEIRGTTGNSGSFGLICGQVSTEGVTSQVGIRRSYVLSDGAVIDANTIGTRYAVVGLRLNPLKRNNTFKVTGFGGVALTADSAIVELVLNPTIANAPLFTSVDNSGVQVATGSVATDPSNTTVTGGTVLGSKLIGTTGGTTGEADIATLLRPGTTIDGIPDEVWVVVTPLGLNLDITGTISWEEL